MKDKLGTESYKGVRDFYPEDMFVQNHIFETMRKVAERFGYLEYGASILEPSELYEAKTSEEIVSEQTYTFKDRGDRMVTLRPEMTPTVARMVAGKARELVFPLRLYTIANVFRYERPQHGRLREHWQLNCDYFIRGDEDITKEVMRAETEIIHLASSILIESGAKKDDFVIKIGSRNAVQAELVHRKIPVEHHKKITQLIDKKGKMDETERLKQLTTLGADFVVSESDDIKQVRTWLDELGIKNVVFDPDIVRGFEYYTGIVFEIFDTSEENKRSLVGGGSYGNLTKLFGNENIHGIGFGMGDVTMRDFLETHNLLPAYKAPTHLSLCVLEESALPFATELADNLRKENINVALNMSFKKAGDQIKAAAKMSIPFALCIGNNEVRNKTFSVKNLSTEKETSCANVQEIANLVLP